MGRVAEYYRGGLAWIPSRTILFGVSGSQSYGTSLPDSDVDTRGIVVPPLRSYIGVKDKFEEVVQTDPDCYLVSVNKFLGLLSSCNPNMLEMLWYDEYLELSRAGQMLLDKRGIFLTTKVKAAFSGYAYDQLSRAKTHRGWLLNPPAAPPTRVEFGLPEKPTVPKDQMDAAISLVRKQLEKWDVDIREFDPAVRIALKERVAEAFTEMLGATRRDLLAATFLGMDSNFSEMIVQERLYRKAVNEWNSYEEWKRSRNPKRAVNEAAQGFDSKNAMHCIRLFTMGVEIMESGKVLVRRPDADMLLEIRRGEWSFEKVVEYADKLSARLEAAVKTCKLPASVDREVVNALCIGIVEAVEADS